MLRAITLVICSYTVLLTVFALPGPPARPNVALFNLPSALTPSGKTSLRYVYQGFGTQSLPLPTFHPPVSLTLCV